MSCTPGDQSSDIFIYVVLVIPFHPYTHTHTYIHQHTPAHSYTHLHTLTHLYTQLPTPAHTYTQTYTHNGWTGFRRTPLFRGDGEATLAAGLARLADWARLAGLGLPSA